MQTLLEKFLNTPVPLSASVERIFSLGIMIFFAQRGLSDAYFQMLVFFERNQYFFVE